jgi:hypothetical protein
MKQEKQTMKRSFAVVLAVLAAAVYAVAAQDKPRVFVTDDPIYEHIGMIRGSSGSSSSAAAASGQYGSAAAAASSSHSSIAGVSHTQNGADPRTVELQADLSKNCPGIVVTNRAEHADFVLLFRRQGGARSSMFAMGGLAGLAMSSAMKVDGASVFNADGDLITATRQRTVEKTIKEVCKSFPAMVTRQAQEPATPAPVVPASTPAAVVVPVTLAAVSQPVLVNASTVSLGDAARQARQHTACVALAKDNPSIACN